MPPVREWAWKAPVPFKEVSAVGSDRPKDCRLGMGSGERVGDVPALLGVASTPAQVFVRKMPPRGETAVDGQTGEEYHAD